MDKVSNDDLKKIVQAFNDYFIVRRDKYLSQYKKDGVGKTVTTIYDKHKPKSFRNIMLNDQLIMRHIRGETNENYGIFASQSGHIKAISFDVDCADNPKMATWFTHKVHYVLINELGLDDSNILINRSGLKGFHIHIFTENLIHVNKAEKLYKLVLQLIEEQSDIQLNQPLQKVIEWKGNASFGIKLPLCRHINNGIRASFVDNYTLLNIDDSAILNIKKIPNEKLYELFDALDEKYIDDIPDPVDKRYYKEPTNDKETIEQIQDLTGRVNKLPIYDLGEDKEYTVDYFNNLLNNGLKARSTRHTSSFLIAIHFKNNFGMTREQAYESLNEWIDGQDKTMYSTPLDECYKDNRLIVDYVYTKDVYLTVQDKVIEVSKSEVLAVLLAKKPNGKPFTIKQKSILFGLLLHSKRYANGNNGNFYATYDQIMQIADVGKRALINQTITELYESGYIEIIRRNEYDQYSDNPQMKLPNIYRMTLHKEKDAINATNINNVKDKTISLKKYDSTTFKTTVDKLFTKKSLQRLDLTRRNIEYFK